jgi:hypothetical protein
MKILNMTETAELIERVIKGFVQNQADLHIALFSSLDHVREHGNTTGLLRLFKGLPNGVRKQGAAVWVKKFSKGKCVPALNPQTKQWQIELSKDRTDADFDIQGAMAVTFADLTAEVAPTTLTAEQFVKNLKKIASNTALNKNNSPKVTAEARSLAMAVVQFIAAEKSKAA